MSLTPQRVPTAREIARDKEPMAVFHTGTNRPYINGEFINMDTHQPIYNIYPKKVKIGKMANEKKYPYSLHFEAWEKIAKPSSFELLGSAIVDAQNKNLEKQMRRQEQLASGILSLAVDETGFKVRGVYLR